MTRNPLVRLHALPGWWRGAAAVRVDEAQAHPVTSEEHRRHMERAAQYERYERKAQGLSA